MPAEVLLVFCPVWGCELPPMGPAYIAAYLEKKGIPCDILDLNVMMYDSSSSQHQDFWKMENLHAWTREDAFEPIRQYFVKEIEEWSQRIIDRGAAVVGFSISGANILFSIEMAKMLRQKKPDICIVFGGPSFSFLQDNPRMPFRFMTSIVNGNALARDGLIDFYVVGEGEESFFEIVVARKAGLPVNRPGIVSGIMRNRAMFRPPVPIADLDSLPFPAWEKFPLERYQNQKELPILFSRGCVNHCAFCNDWRMSNGRFRHRSAKNIFEEIKAMYERFGKNECRSHDLLFNADLKVLNELTDLMIDWGVDYHWSGQGVVRTDMGVPLLKKLKKSGLSTIVYGVESLSDDVLKKMRKPFSFNDIKITLKRTKEAGLSPWLNLIIGFPGETERDFQITKSRLKEIRMYVDALSSLNPCNITASTDLEMFPERFDVVVPEGKEMCEAWETKDGKNTLEVRKRRAREMFQYLQELGIQTKFMGIYD